MENISMAFSNAKTLIVYEAILVDGLNIVLQGVNKKNMKKYLGFFPRPFPRTDPYYKTHRKCVDFQYLVTPYILLELWNKILNATKEMDSYVETSTPPWKCLVR